MTIPERIRKGYRRCECHDLKFKVEPLLIPQYIRRHRDNIMNIMANAMLGDKPGSGKPLKRYQAVCSECGQLYLVAETKKELAACIEASGIELEANFNFKKGGTI